MSEDEKGKGGGPTLLILLLFAAVGGALWLLLGNPDAASNDVDVPGRVSIALTDEERAALEQIRKSRERELAGKPVTEADAIRWLIANEAKRRESAPSPSTAPVEASGQPAPASSGQ